MSLLQSLPPWAVGLVIVGFVTALVVGIYVVATALLRRPQEADSVGDSPLTEQVRELLRNRAEAGSLDAGFDRMVQGSLLGLSPTAAAATVLLVGGLFALAGYLTSFDEIIAGAAGLIGGSFTLGVFWLLRNRRRRAIQEQLPDGCFQLARSLRAGLNLTDALRETTAYTPTPLSRVYDRLTVALSLGESTRRSVERVAEEARVTDFDLFAEVLVLNAESGGNLPAMLDRLAASIRDRNQYRSYFRSVTALSRITAIFLACAMPVGLILYRVFQPEMFDRFVSMPEGRTMLLVAGVLEIIGIVWMALLLRGQEEY